MINKKEILLVSSSFYPEISPRSFRATELAKEYCRKGHLVTVITKYRAHDYTEFLHKYPLTLKMWSKPSFPRIPEFKQRYITFFSKAITRFLLLFFEYPAIEEMFNVKSMLKKETGYDIMISFAVPYPVQWGAAWARSKKNLISKRWFADCGDPFMFQRLDSFRKPFYFKFLERAFCRKCDYIVVPVNAMKNQFYPEFINKIVVIPQGLDLKEFSSGRIGTPVNDKTIIMFAGSIIPGKRDLALFLEFLETVAIDFLFIVYTFQRDWFEKYKRILGNKLELRNFVDRKTLITELSNADFLVNVDTIYDSDTNVEAVPSKLIDYAISGRPILNLSSAYLDEDLVMEFFNKNFRRQRVVDISVYDIESVATKFLI
jgi:hypothetical protein